MDIIDYKECFFQEQIDNDWVWIIENRVGPWVAQKGNSGYWDCVNVYSQFHGILKKGLIRKDFAALIVAIRPKGLKKGKTKEQLKGSMDQFQLSLKLDKITSYAEDSDRGKIVNELKALFSAPIPKTKEEPTPYSVESRIREYLEKRVATDKYVRICNGETYCGFTTTLSIEKYASEHFKNNKMPSVVYVIECVEEKITDDTISKMTGRFEPDKRIRIIIASCSGFDERVKKMAIERYVSLIRVNPQYEITDNDIITPRRECSSVYNYEHQMLSDEVPMTVPLVILDVDYTTTSLTDFLMRNNIPVNNPGRAQAPQLSREFIEDFVSHIIENDVKEYSDLLDKCKPTDKVPYCAIDPYKYAKHDKLKIFRSDLSKQRHLGNIDMQKNVVNLSDRLEEGEPRDRFSMAHEYGHHKLHSHGIFYEFFKYNAELEGEAASDIYEKHWLEVQANSFASCMLMPQELVVRLYNIYWRKWFKCDEVKPMCIKEPMFQNKDFQNVVGPIARHLRVSLEAMKYRLIKLGLLIEPETVEIEF